MQWEMGGKNMKMRDFNTSIIFCPFWHQPLTSLAQLLAVQVDDEHYKIIWHLGKSATAMTTMMMKMMKMKKMTVLGFQLFLYVFGEVAL